MKPRSRALDVLGWVVMIALAVFVSWWAALIFLAGLLYGGIGVIHNAKKYNKGSVL